MPDPTYAFTFILTPAQPGKPETIKQTESASVMACNFGRVTAMQQAGWLAYVYGSCAVRCVETSTSWKITCAREGE